MIASSAQQGSIVIKSIVFPEWWLYAPVPVCFALLAVEFVRRLAGHGALAEAGRMLDPSALAEPMVWWLAGDACCSAC